MVETFLLTTLMQIKETKTLDPMVPTIVQFHLVVNLIMAEMLSKVKAQDPNNSQILLCNQVPQDRVTKIQTFSEPKEPVRPSKNLLLQQIRPHKQDSPTHMLDRMSLVMMKLHSRRIRVDCIKLRSQDKIKNGKVLFLQDQSKKVSTEDFLVKQELEKAGFMVTQMIKIAGRKNRALQAQ